MYIAQYQAAQSALVKYGGPAERIEDSAILQNCLTILVKAYTALPPELQDGLNLAMKELSESYMQRDRLSGDHKHKHVFDSLVNFKAEVVRTESLHKHCVRAETIPEYLQIPHPKEPTPRPKASHL